MRTTHAIHITDAREAPPIAPRSIGLIITSPPYPMIAMWDALFSEMSPAAGRALEAGDGVAAFEAMHQQLDRVWHHCAEALCPGGLLCLNMGDATRTLAGRFQLYPNHARALVGLQAAGLHPLPDILWRKPNNSPTKFMGSGMLPPGAYVTYEHEYVLILRKGNRRMFPAKARSNRRQSAYFWQERNQWFSDLWGNLPGVDQTLTAAARTRSAAFPLELAFRLVCMFSVYGDTVLDPFMGTGTTAAAALIAGRNSLGLERDPSLLPLISARMQAAVAVPRQAQRLAAHRRFVAARRAAGKTFAHHNTPHDVPVITAQEKELTLRACCAIETTGAGQWQGTHLPLPAIA